PAADALLLQAPGMPDLHVEAPRADGMRLDTAVWGAQVTPLFAADAAHAWLSNFIGVDLRLVHMDDACTRRVKAKYDGRYGRDEDVVSLADAVPLLRFRPNLVVAGTAPHAEDGWQRIRIGAIEFEVVKACVRCVFTTVDFE